jgi:D-glycero-D-manno-heptose 1,7-bisphosphate phosphatase
VATIAQQYSWTVTVLLSRTAAISVPSIASGVLQGHGILASPPSDHFALFIVTNQSGVAKGTIFMEDVERVNAYVCSYLAEHGVPIAVTYVCPHERVSGCRCIKPHSYFLKEAERNFGIDLERSFAIGDHPHDVHFATRVGATGVYVLSGHGMKHREEIPANTFIADGIRDATDQILEQKLRSGLAIKHSKSMHRMNR